MNICRRAGSSPEVLYSAFIARRSGVSTLALAASSLVPRSPGLLGREGGRHRLLEHARELGELEQGRPVVLTDDDRPLVAVRPHHVPHRLHVLRDADRIVVEVDREEVEVGAAFGQHMGRT